MSNKFNLTFQEAAEKVFNREGFIQGEDFEKGLYVGLKNDVLVLKKSRDFSFEECNLILSKGVFNQKYRLLTVAIQAEKI